MRGRKNPPLEIVPVPDGAPLTFDTMAQAYLEDYVLQRYRTLTTARASVEHLRGFFGGWARRSDDAGQRAQLPVAPAAAGRRSGDGQPRNLGAQPDVSAGDSPRATGADAEN